MSISVDLHRIAHFRAKYVDGYSWVNIKDREGNCVTLHLERHEVDALADAWEESQRINQETTNGT